jgi:PAS domain S-box-containing protein
MSERKYSKGATAAQSEMLLTKMFEEIQDYAIILLDRDGIVIHWNSGAENIKGYTEDEIVGHHFEIFYPRHDQEAGVPDKLLEEAARSGRAIYEGWRQRKDKTQFWGSIVLTALHNEFGEVIGFSKLTRDLTERKSAEEVLKAKNVELERINQELTSFAYVASHDLQEPLRKIQTFLSRIEEMEKDNLSERSLDYFKRVQSASVRMQMLIQDLLTYSRTSTDQRKPESVDLNELLDTVKKELSDTIREKNAAIESSKLPVISAVRFQMNQLFTNLISNSLKFSTPDVPPRIVIRSEMVTPEVAKDEGAHAFVKHHHISIEDNGIGFEPEYNEKVFELFQRLHGRSEYSGTGIGLAICKKIVENHGGIITASGKKEGGATFHIFLPVA